MFLPVHEAQSCAVTEHAEPATARHTDWAIIRSSSAYVIRIRTPRPYFQHMEFPYAVDRKQDARASAVGRENATRNCPPHRAPRVPDSSTLSVAASTRRSVGGSPLSRVIISNVVHRTARNHSRTAPCRARGSFRPAFSFLRLRQVVQFLSFFRAERRQNDSPSFRPARPCRARQTASQTPVQEIPASNVLTGLLAPVVARIHSQRGNRRVCTPPPARHVRHHGAGTLHATAPFSAAAGGPIMVWPTRPDRH
jgi:hypothetical protein